jgi:(1->4)-alpha-D-glucan 1-alpha-D-glucosylmutase
MLLQTLIGAWPLEPLERLDGFVEKSLREGKLNSTWADPDEAHEQKAKTFARELLQDADFRRDFDALQQRAADAGRRSALAQLTLRFTSPGIPDIYAGDEHEYLALVDPDNRRSVELGPRDSEKSRAIRALLGLRARRPDAFAGAYEPVQAPDGVCAFTRGEDEVLVAVPVRPGARFDPPAGEWSAIDGAPGVYERGRSRRG